MFLSYVCLFDSYSVHSIEMDAGVTRVFERAIVALSRREDPSDTKYVPPLPYFECLYAEYDIHVHRSGISFLGGTMIA